MDRVFVACGYLNVGLKYTPRLYVKNLMFVFESRNSCDLLSAMDIDLSDIDPIEVDHKTKYKTIAFTEDDGELIDQVKRIYGKKGTAEIIRRAARVGLKKALEKKSS